MPVYTFECPSCRSRTDVIRIVEDRAKGPTCGSSKGCRNGRMVRVVERFTPRTFEPYFDEGLGSDVYSEGDRRNIMREMNVIEAGDPVHGGRNFDSKLPNLVEKAPIQGKRHRKARELDTTEVHTVDSAGNTVDGGRWCDLKEPGEKSQFGAKMILPGDQKEV